MRVRKNHFTARQTFCPGRSVRNMNNAHTQDGQKDDALVLNYVVRPGQRTEQGLCADDPENFQSGVQSDPGPRPDQPVTPRAMADCSAGPPGSREDLPDDDEEAAYRLTIRECASFNLPLEKSGGAFAENFQTEFFPGDLRKSDEEAPFISIHLAEPEPFEPATQPPVWKRIFGKKKGEAKKRRLTGSGSTAGKPGLPKRKKLSLPKGRSFLFMLVVVGAVFYMVNGEKSCQRLRITQAPRMHTAPVSSEDLRHAPDDMDNILKARTGPGNAAPEKNSAAAGP